jgi:hypothetical protein
MKILVISEYNNHFLDNSLVYNLLYFNTKLESRIIIIFRIKQNFYKKKFSLKKNK